MEEDRCADEEAEEEDLEDETGDYESFAEVLRVSAGHHGAACLHIVSFSA